MWCYSGKMTTVWVIFHHSVRAISSARRFQGQGGSLYNNNTRHPRMRAVSLWWRVLRWVLSQLSTSSQSTIHTPSDSPSNQPLVQEAEIEAAGLPCCFICQQSDQLEESFFPSWRVIFLVQHFKENRHQESLQSFSFLSVLKQSYLYGSY